MNASHKSSQDTPKDEEEVGRQKRSLNLIADFARGYAKDWHFAVGECFKDQLDIKFTPRVEDKREVMRWTQGKEYCFAEGHVIYDTPKAYLQWDEALKHIACVCSVLSATPNKIKTETKIDTNQKEKKTSKLIAGHVHFKLSKPNVKRDGLQTVGSYDLTQNEFVEFLKTGFLRGKPIKDIFQSASM